LTDLAFKKAKWQPCFSGTKFFFQVLGSSEEALGQLIQKGIWGRGWSKMAPGRVRAGDAKLVR